MFKGNRKLIAAAAGLSMTMVAAGCGNDNNEENNNMNNDGDNNANGNADAGDDGAMVGEGKEIELVFVEWDSEIASTNVVAKVLEDQGYDVTMTPIDNAIMWQSIANGEADGMVAAWLPATHGDLYDEYEDSLVDLGVNLEGARVGLVVPEYMDIDSVGELDQYADEMGGNITGIEPGAGVVQAAEQAVEDYALDGWSVETSSSGAMATALGEAYDNEEPIAVTGWTPHWKFSAYDLKYLEDPEGSFGDVEVIQTMVREGLEDDMPNAYRILDQFFWTTEDMESIMLEVQEGADPADAAADWVEANQDKVDEWLEGVE
ncbi:glycine betaine ABC transporter substrate-binding protein [Salisediminibacterium beveridgei]|uniref:Glycine betaine ABC transport system, glycine betaine-binding protein OpuAC n=1 Tax=Salisediminibacterium beveridgei TaxID=632773 RepID=A0A1D7QZ72_9BACI|nr:glycine betaine ABC transporter substrate-binding protein [Salisediminibacterium beveridgei]AOM84311.1 Glycine betaine ABC transport system, glycine betaine-binding protein OpuAC [Salisediminibacterium beveridgei]